MEQTNRQLLDKLLADNPYKLVASKPTGSQWKKVALVKKDQYYQAEQYTDKQVFHKNMPKEELPDYLEEQLGTHFLQLNSWGENWEYNLTISKKGKWLLGRAKSKGEQAPEAASGHNRQKNYILPEGCVIPPLVDMGIFTQSGQVVKSMYDKYRQINRFIEMVDDALKDGNWKQLNIIDFGCGKSYLTFILYYYFTEIKHLPVTMTGLDLKADVIKNCNAAAAKYGYENLHFELGDINGYQSDKPVDMVVTLHACDTATDYALYNAIRWNASMIFSVPCCQHELNGQIKSDSLSLLTRYGIIKERTAALMTDAIRGNILEACGYRTQILEFIDLSHTPKNLLIRAVKKNSPEEKKEQALQEVKRLMEEFQLDPTLYRLLYGGGKTR